MGSQVDLTDLERDVPSDTGAKQSAPKEKAPSRTQTEKAERELRIRLVACFERISAAIGGRGDTDLADLVNEDAEIMAQGLVSMTRPVRALRAPLLILVAVVEPALAFGRIVRLLAARARDRRNEQPAPDGYADESLVHGDNRPH